jgi:pimeloyl-ACP methyl ester carboxylesterase
LRALLLLLLTLLALPTMAGEAPLRHRVDIGGRNLNLVCMGHGAPTLVFLQGAGDNITGWRKRRPSVERMSRTCFYDRAGFGLSDAPGGPIDVVTVTDDLQRLLRAAGVAGPVVLVGHSLGGYYATAFAQRFPALIAGLVLVDPSFAGQFEYAPGEGDKKIVRDDFRAFAGNLKRCAALARSGGLSPAKTHDCFQIKSGLGEAEKQYLAAQYGRPLYYESALAEYQAFFPQSNWKTRDDELARRFQRPLKNVPIIVLTAGIAVNNPRKSPKGNRDFAAHWKEGHDRLALLSPRGRSVVVPGARHSIQSDRPQAVLDAIRWVLDTARTP